MCMFMCMFYHFLSVKITYLVVLYDGHIKITLKQTTASFALYNVYYCLKCQFPRRSLE